MASFVVKSDKIVNISVSYMLRSTFRCHVVSIGWPKTIFEFVYHISKHRRQILYGYTRVGGASYFNAFIVL